MMVILALFPGTFEVHLLTSMNFLPGQVVFLVLFQLLKYVPAFGAVIIPIVLGVLIFIQPFLGASKKDINLM